MSMDFNELKNWMDAIVDTIEQQKRLSHFNSCIRFADPDDCYLIHSGIEIIADVMGLELEFIEDKSTIVYPYRYRLLYRNIEFVQYRDEPFE